MRDLDHERHMRWAIEIAKGNPGAPSAASWKRIVSPSSRRWPSGWANQKKRTPAQANRSDISWVISAYRCSSGKSLCISSLAMSCPRRSRSLISRVTTYW